MDFTYNPLTMTHTHSQRGGDKPNEINPGSTYVKSLLFPDQYQALTPDDASTYVTIKPVELVADGSAPVTLAGSAADMMLVYKPNCYREAERLSVWARANAGTQWRPMGLIPFSEQISGTYIRRRLVSSRLSVESNTVSTTNATISGELAVGNVDQDYDVTTATQSGVLADTSIRNGAVGSVKASTGVCLLTRPYPGAAFIRSPGGTFGVADDYDSLISVGDYFRPDPTSAGPFIPFVGTPSTNAYFFDAVPGAGYPFPTNTIGDVYLTASQYFLIDGDGAPHFGNFGYEATWETADPGNASIITTVTFGSMGQFAHSAPLGASFGFEFSTDQLPIPAPVPHALLRRLRLYINSPTTSNIASASRSVNILSPFDEAEFSEGITLILATALSVGQKIVMTGCSNFEAVPGASLRRDVRVLPRRTDDSTLLAAQVLLAEGVNYKLVYTIPDWMRVVAMLQDVASPDNLAKLHAWGLSDIGRAFGSALMNQARTGARQVLELAPTFGSRLATAISPGSGAVGEAIGRGVRTLGNMGMDQVDQYGRDRNLWTAGDSDVFGLYLDEDEASTKRARPFFEDDSDGAVDFESLDFDGELRPLTFYTSGRSAAAAAAGPAFTGFDLGDEDEDIEMGTGTSLVPVANNPTAMEEVFVQNPNGDRRPIISYLEGRSCPYANKAIQFRSGAIDVWSTYLGMGHFPTVATNSQGKFSPSTSGCYSILSSVLPFRTIPKTNLRTADGAGVSYYALSDRPALVFSSNLGRVSADRFEQYFRQLYDGVVGLPDRPIYITCTAPGQTDGDSWHMAAAVALFATDWRNIYSGVVADGGLFGVPDMAPLKLVVFTARAHQRRLIFGRIGAANARSQLIQALDGDHMLAPLARAGLNVDEANAARSSIRISSLNESIVGSAAGEPGSVHFAATIGDVYAKNGYHTTTVGVPSVAKSAYKEEGLELMLPVFGKEHAMASVAVTDPEAFETYIAPYKKREVSGEKLMPKAVLEGAYGMMHALINGTKDAKAYKSVKDGMTNFFVRLNKKSINFDKSVSAKQQWSAKALAPPSGSFTVLADASVEAAPSAPAAAPPAKKAKKGGQTK